ncbi:MAG TPA: DNA-directed RNA polymerase subunit omega [bacterium]|nr:DNA-directed RNA polymerase subunit omega [bacterium]
MARITVEDCLKNVDNRFGLVMLGVKRAKQLLAGADRMVKCDNKDIICGLREIAGGAVKPVVPKNAVEPGKPAKLVPITLKDPDDI